MFLGFTRVFIRVTSHEAAGRGPMGVSCDYVRKGRGKRVERLMCLYVGACVCLSTATFGKLLSHLGLCVIFQ